MNIPSVRNGGTVKPDCRKICTELYRSRPTVEQHEERKKSVSERFGEARNVFSLQIVVLHGGK
jgi:hypothetical protein